ncbi:MAG: hypothetical protein ACK55I_41670, partial [bacterium]
MLERSDDGLNQLVRMRVRVDSRRTVSGGRRSEQTEGLHALYQRRDCLGVDVLHTKPVQVNGDVARPWQHSLHRWACGVGDAVCTGGSGGMMYEGARRRGREDGGVTVTMLNQPLTGLGDVVSQDGLHDSEWDSVLHGGSPP